MATWQAGYGWFCLYFALGAALGYADSRATVQKAIQAQGGEESLARSKNVTTRTQGKLVEGGQAGNYSAVRRTEIPDRIRLDITVEADVPVKRTIVVNGSVGWYKVNANAAIELNRKELAFVHRAMYLDHLQTLLPLLHEKHYTMKMLGESQLEGKTLVGILVSAKAKPPVELFFDKESGLFARWSFKDDDGEIQEIRYYDYKNFDGLKFPTRWAAYKGKEKIQETQLMEIEFHKGNNTSAFAKP